MSSVCCVPGCRGNQKHGPSVRMFSFPSNPELCQKWISAVSSDDFTPTVETRICELHFDKNDLIYSSTALDSLPGEGITDSVSYPKLKPNAVPSIFLQIKSQISKPATGPDVYSTVMEEPVIPLPKASETNIEMLGNLRNGIKFVNPLALNQDLITQAIGNTIAEKKSIKNTIICLKDNMYLIPASYFGKTYVNINGSPIKLPPLQINQVPEDIRQNALQPQPNDPPSEFFVPAVSNIIQASDLVLSQSPSFTSVQSNNDGTSAVPCDCGLATHMPNACKSLSFSSIKLKLTNKMNTKTVPRILARSANSTHLNPLHKAVARPVNSTVSKPVPKPIAPADPPPKEPELVHPIWPKRKVHRKIDLEGFSWYDRLGFYKSEVLRAKAVLYKIDCMVSETKSEIRKLQHELDMTYPLKALVNRYTPLEARVTLNPREIHNYFRECGRNRIKKVNKTKMKELIGRKKQKPPKKRPVVRKAQTYKYRKPHTIPVDCDVPLSFESAPYTYLQEINFEKKVFFINQHNFSEMDYDNINAETVFFINTSDIITEMCLEMFPPLRQAVDTARVEIIDEAYIESFFKSKSWVYQGVGKQLSMLDNSATKKREFKDFLLSSVI